MRKLKSIAIDIMLALYDTSQLWPAMFTKIWSWAILVLLAIAVIISGAVAGIPFLMNVGAVCAVVWGVILVIHIIIAYRRNRSGW